MPTNVNVEKPFTYELINQGLNIRLELTNTSDQTIKCLEILDVFLKDEEAPGGPSIAHIKFKDTECVSPRGKVVVSHRTWINGKPSDACRGQLERLKVLADQIKPYVLDISWTNEEGRSRFQRIPVGH